MRYFIFLLFLCLFFQESTAGKTAGSLEDSEGLPSTSASIPKPVAKSFPLEEFSQKVRLTAENHDAYAYLLLLEEFRKLDVQEVIWEEAASKQKIEKWPLQSSWKIAVGAQLFLDAAIDLPHQNLLRNGLRPLLSWVSEVGSLEESYAEATSTIHEIIRTHPYIRRRAALYALTAAALLQHPLARLFLTETLRCYDDKPSRFFRKNHYLIKAGISLEEGKESLRCFIDVPGIEGFVDLRNKMDLKDPDKLGEKAQLGLPHYNVLLGDFMDKKTRWNFSCPPEIVDPIIKQYRRAADKGDFEGCFKVSNLMNAASGRRIKSTQPLEKQLQYLFLAAWHGNEEAFPYASVRNILEKKNIPGSKTAIFKAVRSFLTPKHKQQISLKNIKLKQKKVKSFLRTIPEL